MLGLKDHYFRFIINKLFNGFESQHINKSSARGAKAAV